MATYSATKAAAYSITQALAQELAPHDVRVLSVHPGPVRTEMLPERLLALAEAPSAVAALAGAAVVVASVAAELLRRAS